MSENSFHEMLLNCFGLAPTDQQKVLFLELEKFARKREGRNLFVLKGYAGTGKTSVLGADVRALSEFKVRTKLLAPTGRAAKVFSLKSNQEALTIHKQIYRRKSKVDLTSPLGLQPNLFKNTLFIVDEASMIGDYSLQNDGNISSRNLLDDLFEYVFSGVNCKLILLGDTGQLPPVGSDFSPALNEDYLKNHYPMLSIDSFMLSEVLRQASGSSVLKNATILRNTAWERYPTFQLEKGGDLRRLEGNELQDELESSFSNKGVEETILITRSNKRANEFNRQIRSRILWYEEELCPGDSLMVVKNNYFWLGDDTKVGFIANGEIIKIKRILRLEELYGFHFARVMVSFVDYDELGDIELLIHTEALTAEGPAIPRNRMKELFYEIERDYAHLRDKKKRYEAILSDPYFNALQVKYAYAVTCHKSQGGQWSDVYIDQGYLTDEMLGTDYYRWLYTALTRATDKVFLVNFSDDFFPESLSE